MPGVLTPQQANRLLHATRVGNASAAWKQLWSHGLAAPTPDNCQLLAEKWGHHNPLADAPMEVPVLSAEQFNDIFAPSVVEQAVGNLKEGKAADILGWDQDLFRTVFLHPRLCDLCSQIISLWIRDRLSSRLSNISYAQC